MYFEVGCRALPKAGFVDSVLHVVRHCLVRNVEDRRLVHIIPKSCNPVRDELLVQRSPPLPGLRPGKVRKHGGTRPDLPGVNAAIRVLHKLIACATGIVRRIPNVGLLGDVQVGDDDKFEILAAEILHHPGEVRIRLVVDRERPVLMLKINVQPEHVAWNAVAAQTIRDFAKLRFREIGIARLLKAERPQRRQRRRSGKPRPVFNHIFGVGTVHQVIVNGPVQGPEGVLGRVSTSEIEIGSPGVVQKDPKRPPMIHL